MQETQNHAERIAAAVRESAAALGEALDAYRAEGAREFGGGPERLNWPALVQYLVDHPPYHAYNPASPAALLRALWCEVPVNTPYGDVLATLMRTDDDAAEDSPSFSLTVPTGGSFIVNGKQYAPEEGSHVTGTTINVSRVTSHWARQAWRIQHNSFASPELTDAARTRLAEWIEAEGFDLIFTPARVMARNLTDGAIAANRAREDRDKAHAAAIVADADWNHAAGALHLVLNAASIAGGVA